MTKQKIANSEILANLAVEGMKEKKGHEIVKIDLRGLNASVVIIPHRRSASNRAVYHWQR